MYASPIITKATSELVGWVCVHEGSDDDMIKEATKQAKEVLKVVNKKGVEIEAFTFKDLTQVTEDEMKLIPSPGS